jgi:hypothetical protein
MSRCDPATTDLREALLALEQACFAPDEPSPSPAADTGNEPPDGAAGDGEGTDELDNEDEATDEAKVSRVKELSDEAAKWRRKFREANDRIDTLEKGNADEALKVENQDLRLRMAFNDECHAHDVSDRDAIWKLAGDDIRVAVNEDGTVDPARLRTVVGSLVERYPHFVKDEGPDWEPPTGPPSGKRTDGKVRSMENGTPSATLMQKFPALRGR